MTKQVALSERAYRRLRAARREGESFSQAIERLLRGVEEAKGGALAWAEDEHGLVDDTNDLLRWIESGKDVDEDPWSEASRAGA